MNNESTLIKEKDLITKFKNIWGFIPEDIWKSYQESLEKINIPAKEKSRGIYYGVYCGPASKNNALPIDGLDLGCQFHDDFFQIGKEADIALQKTAKMLQDENMLQSKSANQYANRIQSKLFLAFSSAWREVYWFIILLALFIILAIVIVFIITFVVLKKQKS